MIADCIKGAAGLVVGAAGYWVSAQVQPCRPWSDIVIVITLATIAIVCWHKSRTQ